MGTSFSATVSATLDPEKPFAWILYGFSCGGEAYAEQTVASQTTSMLDDNTESHIFDFLTRRELGRTRAAQNCWRHRTAAQTQSLWRCHHMHIFHSFLEMLQSQHRETD